MGKQLRVCLLCVAVMVLLMCRRCRLGGSNRRSSKQLDILIKNDLQRTDEHKILQDGMVKVLEGVQAVKVFVNQAVKASPEASLVRAGVCVVLPLLTNPDFYYVASCHVYYLEVKHFLWSEDEWERLELAKLKKDPLCDSWAKLYKKMLEYQLKSVIKLHCSGRKNLIKDMMPSDYWRAMVDNIRSLEKVESDTKEIRHALQGRNLDCIEQKCEDIAIPCADY